MKINLLGSFSSLDEVWAQYPEGGREGDYVIIGSTEIEWNKYTHNWGDEGSESSSVRPAQTFDGDVYINGDLRVGGKFISDTLDNYASKAALNSVKESIKTDEELLLFLEENGYKPNSDNAGDSGGSEDSGGEEDSSPESIDIMNGVNVDNSTIVKKDNGSGDKVLQINTDNPTSYVPVDGVTLQYDTVNRYFKVIGGTSSEGGSSSGGITTEQLTEILKGYAKTSDSLPNPQALTFGSKTYNGSNAVTLTASDLGALTSHQTIYKLTFAAGQFSETSFTANSAKKTVNIPSSVSHLTGGTLDGDLTVDGDLLADHVTSLSTSDERLKKNIRTFSATEILQSMGGVKKYEYTEEEVKRNPANAGTHIGFIYQNVEKSQMADKMCCKRVDGYGALNYLSSDYQALLAAVILEQAEEIRHLKEIIKKTA